MLAGDKVVAYPLYAITLLWAFDNGDKIKTGERMMGQLERRTDAILGELTSQNIANTLCERCTFVSGKCRNSLVHRDEYIFVVDSCHLLNSNQVIR